MRYYIRECSLANQEHASCKRQYAHVFHKRGVICVAGDLFAASENVWLGVICHEIGHIILARNWPDHTERQADLAASDEFKTTITRRTTPEGDHMEYIANKSLRRVGKLLDKWIKP